MFAIDNFIQQSKTVGAVDNKHVGQPTANE